VQSIRAGIVKRPEDYRWCGFAEVMVGLKEAVSGLTRLMTLGKEPELAATFIFMKDVLTPYRSLVYEQGVEIREDEGKPHDAAGLRDGVGGSPDVVRRRRVRYRGRVPEGPQIADR
jgi:hypothetical protein